MKSLIKLEHITKAINGVSILKDISFDVNNGEIFGIIGKNGAGKTTLLRVLIGFYHYDFGKYSIYDDEKIPLNKDFLKSNFGFATQENCFYDDLTVFENIKYFGRMYFMKKEALLGKIEDVLEVVELKTQRNVLAKNLSGGMKRRLDLACSLVHSPHVLLLDEPTAELDPVAANHMWKTLKNINKQGTTIILSSHFLNRVDHVCDRIAILDEGFVMEVGTPKELKDLYSQNEEIVLQTFPANYDQVIFYLKNSGVEITNLIVRDKSLVIYTKEPAKVLQLVLKVLNLLNETLLELEVNKPSLNEIFESVTAKKMKRKSADKLVKYVESSVEKFKDSKLREKLLKAYPKEVVDRVLKKR
ncbi:ABC transporter ATP-binding protein [Candidatus Woesearchaeota archaeon]|nr:ABC transporter ATP-binding protein [Candidatus Woesearchaeota archaeon]